MNSDEIDSHTRRGCQGSFLHKTLKKRTQPGRDKRAFALFAGKQSVGRREDKDEAASSESNHVKH